MHSLCSNYMHIRIASAWSPAFTTRRTLVCIHSYGRLSDPVDLHAELPVLFLKHVGTRVTKPASQTKESYLVIVRACCNRTVSFS